MSMCMSSIRGFAGMELGSCLCGDLRHNWRFGAFGRAHVPGIHAHIPALGCGFALVDRFGVADMAHLRMICNRYLTHRPEHMYISSIPGLRWNGACVILHAMIELHARASGASGHAQHITPPSPAHARMPNRPVDIKQCVNVTQAPARLARERCISTFSQKLT